MKANFPAQYMTAHLSSVTGEIDNVADLVYEAKRIGLTVLPPGLNESDTLFTTEKNKEGNEHIRIGLATIKQVGNAAAKAITEERESGGLYTSLEDFFVRIAPHQVMNRRNITALIKVGVFDAFSDRNTLLENIELMLHCVKDTGDVSEQHALFDAAPTVTLNLKPAQKKVIKRKSCTGKKNCSVFMFQDIRSTCSGATVCTSGILKIRKIWDECSPPVLSKTSSRSEIKEVRKCFS